MTILRATGSSPTGAAGCQLLVKYARQWPDRVWAVEGANGIGRALAQRLLAVGEWVRGRGFCAPAVGEGKKR